LLTNNILADAVVDVANLFVQPKGIIEDENITGSDFQYLVDEGINVLAHEGFGQLHHKYAIIDHTQPGSDPIVITGSHNWSASAESVNDENTLIIHDATIANLFHQEFTARYNELTLSTSEAVELELNVAPNPANDWVNMEFAGLGGSALITFYSLEGKVVQQLNIQSFRGANALTLDISSLPRGFYLLEYREGNQKGVQKLSVLR
jgi:hypothetical protein